MAVLALPRPIAFCPDDRILAAELHGCEHVNHVVLALCLGLLDFMHMHEVRLVLRKQTTAVAVAGEEAVVSRGPLST